MTRILFVLFASLALATPLVAQSPELEQAYERAATLVRDGQGADGRRIVDSLFVRAREGTAEHAEALFWRAALATDAQQAERDYRNLVVNYPLSRRAGRALLSLAQLELARGDRERALSHLQRLQREHPADDTRATAAFWTARVRFDMNDEPRACVALDDAQRSVAPADAELRNQIEFLAGRCLGVVRDTTPMAAVAGRPSAGATSNPRSASPNAGASPAQRAAATSDSRRTTSYAVQLAAYNTRTDAEALVTRLARRGITARVVGSAKPFRVWTGEFATRTEANTALRALRDQKIEGFVVQQPARP